MRIRIIAVTALLALASLLGAAASSSKSTTTNSPIVVQNQDQDAMRIEGERRFKANCGRCHAAPHKFPPRMMATIVRHMRVRATITDEDRRLILFYMTQ